MRCSLLQFSIGLLLFAVPNISSQQYEIPPLVLEAFSPKGFRASIPDVPGLVLFTFNGRKNAPFANAEEGQFSQEVTEGLNGYWSYENKDLELKPGDVIHYWVFVQHKNLGYVREKLQWTVQALVPYSSTISATSSPNVNQCKEPSTTTVRGKQACKGALIFEDDFSSPNIDRNKWTPQHAIAGKPDYEFVSYQNNPKNIYIKDRALNLRPTLLEDDHDRNFILTGTLDLSNGCTGAAGTATCRKTGETFNILPPIVSAKLKTKDQFSFRYGIVEISAKLPAGDWIYPQLYLEPKDEFYGSDYASGRICLGLSRGNTNLVGSKGEKLNANQLYGGVMLTQSDPARWFGLHAKELTYEPWHSGTHTFTLVWAPDRLTVAVDNVVYSDVPTPPSGFSHILAQYNLPYSSKWAEKNAPFDKEFYITLGVGVGGISDFPNKAVSGQYEKPWSNRDPKAMLNFWENKNKWYPTWNGDAVALKIKHVKVWAL